MKTLTIATMVAALVLSTDAVAQHQGHQPPPSAEAQQAEPQSQKPSEQPTPAVEQSQMDHAQMDHSAHAATRAPRTPIPVLTAADRQAARPAAHDHPVHDATVQSKVLFDRLESSDADDGPGIEWEGQAWIGTDSDRLWLRTEGERVDGHTEAADLEAMYGRPVGRWWDLLAGVRHAFKPGASRDWAAIGVVGIAPYKFEVEATAYIGPSGRTAARIEAEYDLLFTNRLILQPLVEANFHGKDDARRGVASGLSTMEAGLRLRYELRREFAPYIGVVSQRAFGETADLRRSSGERVSDTRIVAGVRVWF